ncbi:MAG TPA: hypothetical protein VFT84_00180 [Gemmatimonadales bacterium]|nr:hypothetical protein [Gemmatimonadales bacterium]
MKLVDVEETVVLVTPADEDGEGRDRPAAYALKAEIDSRGAGHAYRRAVVVPDQWYLDHPTLQHHPTIAIGGPGVNGVSEEFTSVLPMVYSRNEQVFVQADLEGELKRAALWGVNAAATAAAVEAFVSEGMLDDLLGKIWRFRVGTMV